VEVKLYAFLTSTINGGEWAASRSGHLYPRGKSSQHQFHRMLGGQMNWSECCKGKKAVFRGYTEKGAQWKCSAVRFFFSRFHLNAALSDSVHIIPIYKSHNCTRPVVQSDTNHLTHTYSVHTHSLYWYGELTTKTVQDTHNVLWCNIQERSRYYGCTGKVTKYYIILVCVCSLRYSAFNAQAPYYLVVCLALQYFSALSHKRHNFLKYYWTQNVCFYFLYNFCLKHFSF
jgi:hypothetical protein